MSSDVVASRKLLHLIVGICLRHYVVVVSLRRSESAQRAAVNAVRLVAALLAEAVREGGEMGSAAVRMILPPLMKPMLTGVLAKVRMWASPDESIQRCYTA